METPEELEGGREMELGDALLIRLEVMKGYEKFLEKHEALIREDQRKGLPVFPAWLEAVQQGRKMLDEIPKE
jgi:hypothetical protein